MLLPLRQCSSLCVRCSSVCARCSSPCAGAAPPLTLNEAPHGDRRGSTWRQARLPLASGVAPLASGVAPLAPGVGALVPCVDPLVLGVTVHLCRVLLPLRQVRRPLRKKLGINVTRYTAWYAGSEADAFDIVPTATQRCVECEGVGDDVLCARQNSRWRCVAQWSAGGTAHRQLHQSSTFTAFKDPPSEHPSRGLYIPRVPCHHCEQATVQTGWSS
jgi:hypothetical protein